MILIVGLPATGKTMLAQQIASSMRVPSLTTEDIRARLLGISHVEEDCDFTPQETVITYRALAILADLVLSLRSSVVIDGVFREQQQRAAMGDIADRHGARFYGIATICPEVEALRRLRERKNRGTVAPAGELTYRKIAAEFVPPPSTYLTVDTTVGDDISRILTTFQAKLTP